MTVIKIQEPMDDKKPIPFIINWNIEVWTKTKIKSPKMQQKLNRKKQKHKIKNQKFNQKIS